MASIANKNDGIRIVTFKKAQNIGTGTEEVSTKNYPEKIYSVKMLYQKIKCEKKSLE